MLPNHLVKPLTIFSGVDKFFTFSLPAIISFVNSSSASFNKSAYSLALSTVFLRSSLSALISSDESSENKNLNSVSRFTYVFNDSLAVSNTSANF